MLDLHRLMLLREVHMRGSMSAVARALSYSHSAISQQLGLLQKEAGVVLFERVGRNVKVTPAGEGLVRNTEAILAAVERAQADLAIARGKPLGVVNVAAIATISRTVMPRALVQLSQDHPGLEVRLHLFDPEAALERLLSRQVDAVLADAYPGCDPPLSDAVHTSVLAEDPVRAYVPDPAMDVYSASFRKMPWVMEPRTTGSAKWAMRVCWERGIDPLVAHESSDLLFHLRMAEHRLAAAFLPDMVLREAGVDLDPCEALPWGTRRIVFLVRTGAEESPSLVALRESILAHLDM